MMEHAELQSDQIKETNVFWIKKTYYKYKLNG